MRFLMHMRGTKDTWQHAGCVCYAEDSSVNKDAGSNLPCVSVSSLRVSYKHHTNSNTITSIFWAGLIGGVKSITDAPDASLTHCTTSLQNHQSGCKWKVIHLSRECKMGNSLTPILSTKAGNVDLKTTDQRNPKLRNN